MEQFHNSKATFTKPFLVFGLILLAATLIFGLLGAIEYTFSGIWRNTLSFEKIRPLHVSSAVFWILMTAVGCVFTFLREHNREELKHTKFIRLIFFIFAFSFSTILVSYFFGIFGGREYWEFNPYFSIPITVGWVLVIYVFLSNLKTLKNQPVYVWMWFTGVLFFLFTYLESNLWVIPEIRNNLVKDMTIQWKSYGSLVGSWNLLIYGSSIYLMDKIAGTKKYSYSSTAFWIYFLGLFNLMFNWGHHIYTLPTEPYVRHIAYFVSMTELLLFGRTIYLWKSSAREGKKNFNIEAYRFMLAADVWVFLTLGLAIVMSVPALNVYMHGTHIVVAHTMGATIGINSMLLLAFIANIYSKVKLSEKTVQKGYWIINGSLLVFWFALIGAGIIKAYWQFNKPDFVYADLMNTIRPCFYAFLLSGITLIIGFFMVIVPFIRRRH